jgi:hypothetical protein
MSRVYIAVPGSRYGTPRRRGVQQSGQSGLHEAGGLTDLGRRNEIDGAKLIAASPPAPVRELGEHAVELIEVPRRQLRGALAADSG